MPTSTACWIEQNGSAAVPDPGEGQTALSTNHSAPDAGRAGDSMHGTATSHLRQSDRKSTSSSERVFLIPYPDRRQLSTPNAVCFGLIQARSCAARCPPAGGAT